jgi:phage terminase small subunit
MTGLPLKNPRWEKFCQRYVRGETAGNATASYLAAGFTSSRANAKVHASRLMRTPAVPARIAELQRDMLEMEETALKTATDRLALRKHAVLNEMANIGFANLLNYVRQNADGDLVIDLAAIERDQGAGLVELQMTDTGEGEKRRRTVKIKLGDKFPALVHLGKHLGLFVERKGESDDDLRRMSEDELRNELARLQREDGSDDGEPAESGGDTARTLPAPPKDEA